MAQQKIAPCGSWRSPITSDLIVSEVVALSQPAIDEGDVYWIEMRPSEAGRSVIVRRNFAGVTNDVTLPPFNARTRVHEYGGGDYVVRNGSIYFSNFDDQRLYVQAGDLAPQPIIPAEQMRYADCVLDHNRNRLICVREDHSEVKSEPINSIVAIDLSNSNPGAGAIIASGNNFY